MFDESVHKNTEYVAILNILRERKFLFLKAFSHK